MAEELFTKEFLDVHGENPTRSTRRELREAGYFYRAKCMVLRDIHRENRGSRRRSGDEEDFLDYVSEFGGRRRGADIQKRACGAHL